MLNITLPGTGGTMPLKNRWLSSCILSLNGHSILIDCGEGTQIALKNTGHKFKSVDAICITHFHADHILGLPGFLLTMSNEGRTEPVTIFGPEGIEYVVKRLCVVAPYLTFDINFEEIKSFDSFYKKQLIITPFRTKHSIPCIGYPFEVNRVGKFNVQKAKQNNVPLSVWSVLQKQKSVTFDGKLYTSDMVLEGPRRGIKFTYCTDSRPTESIRNAAQGSDLFVCEGMYGDDGKILQAKEKGHMLFSEAARLAKDAGVDKLLLTHYSPSLEYPEKEIESAKSIFENTECGYDGKSIDLNFKD